MRMNCGCTKFPEEGTWNTDTLSLLLTFNRLFLSQEVYCAWCRLPVKAYVCNPLSVSTTRVSGMQRAPASASKLASLLCSSLAGELAMAGSAPFSVKCYHNSGAHLAFSKDCDRYKCGREIPLMCTQEKVSFPEAKKRWLTRLLRPGITYALVLGKFITRRSPSNLSVRHSQHSGWVNSIFYLK